MVNFFISGYQLELLKKEKLMRRLDRGILIKLYYTEQMSLNEIGKLYDVTRERVRQWMEREKLARRKIGWNFKDRLGKYKFSSPNEYFNYVRKTGKESYWTLRRFLHSRKNCCDECGSKTSLHEHHLKYPANSFKDVQLLCASCHLAKHRKGNGNKKQLEICTKYKNGQTTKELAKKYRVHRSLIYYFLHKWGINRIPLLPEERKNYTSNYYQKNRDRLLAYKEKWYQKNKEKIKAHRQQRYWNKKLALVN